MPTRWLIGPGLLLVGIGLLLMAGISGTSDWTHLIPGFIVAGFGSGLVNPPLASTAIGVVPPQQAGMASGINSTFRQVGVATGIAALGSMFTAAISGHLAGALPPSLAGSAGSMVSAIRQGSVAQLIASVPPAQPRRRRARAAVELRHRAQRAALRDRGPRPRRRGVRDGADPQEGLPPAGRWRAGAGRADAGAGTGLRRADAAGPAGRRIQRTLRRRGFLPNSPDDEIGRRHRGGRAERGHAIRSG